MLEGCKGCCAGAILIPLLCCAFAACSVVYVNTQGPDAPLSKFSANITDAQTFENELDRAGNQASSEGWFVLNFNEQQLSSWMALEGEAFADEHGHSFPFEDVQVGLDDGQFTFYGELQQGVIKLPVEVVIEPQFDSSGHLELDIVSANLGGLSLPDFVLENVQDQFEDLLTEPFDDLATDYFFFAESLDIEDGVFVVQGQTR